MTAWLGRYRDPWFGEISICERDGHVRFNSVKSPLMAGDVMRVGERLLVDWDDVSVDVEPWLTFTAGKPVTLTLAKVDPDGDFSSDYEDLSFTRIGACKPSPKAAPLSDADAIAQVDELMRSYSGAVPGASVLVLRDGKPVVRRSYGLADLEQHTPASPATNYRLASVTKQFTAAAILLLNEANKLRLDDPVRKWLPELPEAAQPVTIRHLLTHTGGLIDYEDFVADDAPQVHDADVLRLLAKQNRTYFKAGSSYRYSNSGYALLALIVEQASGQRFAAFLRDRIFAPLGMQTPSHSRTAFRPFRSVPMATAPAAAPGRAPTRAPPAPCSAMAASIRPSTISRSGMRRSTTIGCCAKSPGARLHAGHAYRQPEHRLRLRLARHRRNALAFGRDTGLQKRDHPVSGTEADRHRAHQSQRPRALFHRARHRAALPARRRAPVIQQRRRHPRTAGGDAGRRLLDHAFRAAVLATLLSSMSRRSCSAISCRRSTTRSD